MNKQIYIFTIATDTYNIFLEKQFETLNYLLPTINNKNFFIISDKKYDLTNIKDKYNLNTYNLYQYLIPNTNYSITNINKLHVIKWALIQNDIDFSENDLFMFFDSDTYFIEKSKDYWNNFIDNLQTHDFTINMWLSWNIWEDIFHWGKNILESNNEFCKEFSAYYEINDKSKWIQASFFAGKISMLNKLIDKFDEFMINDTKYVHYRHMPPAAEESYLTKIVNDNFISNEFNITCKYYAINFFDEFKKYLNIESINEYEEKFPNVFIVQKYASHLKKKRHAVSVKQTEDELKKYINNCYPYHPRNKYGFDKIYCFNLYTSNERYEFMKNQFDKLNLEVNFIRSFSINTPNTYFSNQAFDGLPTPGAILDYVTKLYSIIKESLLKNYDHILIFEDDVIIDNDKFLEMINFIPSDYDIIRFGFTKDDNLLNPENANIYNNYFCINKYVNYWGVFTVALSRKGMEYFVNYIDNKLCQADLPFFDVNMINNNNLVNYYCYANIFTHNYEFHTTMKIV